MLIQKFLNRNNLSETKLAHSRRHFLKTGLSACTLLALPLATTAHAAVTKKRPFEKKLSFLNLHTGERVRQVYWANGRYVPGALREINHVLRDHRTGDRYAIDPELFDILHLLQRKLGTNQEFHVISAYRSPASNQMLAAQSGGVAKNSLHTHGKAIDIRLPGRRLSDLRTAAMSLQTGGVGYYPASNFVHLDTGNFRFWGG